MKLANKKCNDSVTVPTLTMRQARGLLKHLARGWRINRNGRLQSQYVFMNFAKALAFANKIGVIAEAEKHHPDLYVAWGKCKIEIWSHKVKGPRRATLCWLRNVIVYPSRPPRDQSHNGYAAVGSSGVKWAQ